MKNEANELIEFAELHWEDVIKDPTIFSIMNDLATARQVTGYVPSALLYELSDRIEQRLKEMKKEYETN